MNKAALRVGVLAVAGIVLLALTVAAVGGDWFATRERAEMRFERSVYGLNVGAAVVLRGVRVGQVQSVRLAPAGPGEPGGLAMPVVAEFDRALLADLLGPDAPATGRVLPVLIARGLVARLSTQSLLTGLLYVDLDIDPKRAAAVLASPASNLPNIPTQATRLQTLQSQLEGMDLAQIGQDLAAMASSARQLLAGPELAQVLQRSAAAALQVQTLAETLARAVPPLARSADATLADARRAIAQVAPLAGQVGQATAQVGSAAQQVGAAASQAQALVVAAAPALADVRQMAVQLGQAAAALRDVAAEDSALRQNTDRALQDVARAARSLRELGDTLERHPDALLRGRQAEPGTLAP